ncbi:MAG: homoserine kinase [Actinomycetota bacterium]|nr:homoserine kinase [Actinomycetota bacterium]
MTARIPATSANLGPGFDSLALALDLCNEITIDTEGPADVTWEGEGADSLPRDGSDLVNAAFRSVFAVAERPAPEISLLGVNRIPVTRGLGSSAAAVVGGVALGFAALGWEHDPHRMESFTNPFESHHDNVAAALHGGLTVAYAADGGWSAERLEPHPELRPVLLVPEVELSTTLARDALPAQVELTDATFNIGRTALAVLALTRDPGLLPVALEDRLHQRVRLDLVPEVRDAFERLRSGGIPLCVSGAGPSLLAFESDEHPVQAPDGGWRALRLKVRARGVEVASA